MLAAVVALASTALVSLAPAASAAPLMGSVSGTVVDEHGVGLADVCVMVPNAGSTTTASDGEYSLAGVPVGQQTVRFSDCGDPRAYLAQWYLGQPDENSAQSVEVFDSVDTPLQDVHMVPGVSVTGRVTDSSGDPIQGITVNLESNGPYNGETAITDLNGEYRAGPVQDGDYFVRFFENSASPTYAGEYWNHAYQHSQATSLTIRVMNGTEVPGINAQLSLDATVTGQVRDVGGNGLDGICVSANTPSNQGREGIGFTSTDVDGNYTLSGLPPVETRIEFHQCNGPAQFTDQWYNAAPSFEQSQALQLQPGDVLGGIDATMVSGTVISGHVTDSGGNPLPGIWVSADSDDDSTHGGGLTDPSGNYRTNAMPPGSYRVRFQDGSGSYAAEFWNNAYTDRDASRVTINGGDPELTGIDASLSVGARISGTVTRPDGEPAVGFCVGAAYGAGDDPDGIGGAQVDASGHYVLAGLPAGSFRVRFGDCNRSGPYQSQWYDNASSAALAQIINLQPGDDITGIDARLEPAIQISGTVTDSGNHGLSGICAQASTDSFVGGIGHTDGNGNYSINLARAGSYKVQFVDCGNPYADPPEPSGNHLGEWWGGDIEPASAVPIDVGPGQSVTGIDATLPLASSAGTVTGRVANLRGQPIQACVALFLPNDFVLFTQTDSDGVYRFTDVPTGTWTIGILGCAPDDVDPVVTDPNTPGVSYWAQWWRGARVTIGGSDEAPDSIAQGATPITVHPGEAVTADMCFGCGAVAAATVTIDPDASSVTFSFDTPGIVSADASGLSIQSVFSYSINCTSAAGAPTSARGGSPLTVSGFTRGVAYSCLGQAYSGSTLVANSMAFNVTVGAPAPTIPGTTAPAAIPTAITDFGGASDVGSSPDRSTVGSSAPNSLAYTGSDNTLVVQVALAMILLGVGIIERRRRLTNPLP